MLLEPLHCGVPVVATPVGGGAETNGDALCGTIVPHDDTEALANAIEQLERDPVRRARMAAQARLRAPNFSVPVMAGRTEALYPAGPPALSTGT